MNRRANVAMSVIYAAGAGIWLTTEEEEGYYYGFSNEGMWPLCHLAYVRPAFREQDWIAYRAVNEKFAGVVAAEAAGESPVILIQDFHFAHARFFPLQGRHLQHH